MAPNALQGASLKKHRGANTVPIMNGKTFYLKYFCRQTHFAFSVHFLITASARIFDASSP